MNFQFSLKSHVKVLTSWKPFILGHAIQGLIGGVMKLIYPILEPDPVSWNNIIAGLRIMLVHVECNLFHDAHERA